MALAKRSFHSSFLVLKRSTDHLVAKDKQKYKLVAFPEPTPASPEQLADATRLFARPVNFIQSISKAEQAPDTTKPEVRYDTQVLFSVNINKLY